MVVVQIKIVPLMRTHLDSGTDVNNIGSFTSLYKAFLPVREVLNLSIQTITNSV